MIPDIIIVNSDVRYRTELKEYLEESGLANVRVSETLPTEFEACGKSIIIACGDTLNYSDLLTATHGDRVRFILTYDGQAIIADSGLAKCAHCVRGSENFEYILSVVKEEINDYFTCTKCRCSEENFVTDILDGLGFNPNHKGYAYIVSAVGATFGEMITKDVYPDIAKEYKTTPSAVERNIRSAIAAAWCRGGIERFGRYIGWCDTKRPTNAEFIAAVASRARLEELKQHGKITR